MEGIIILNTTVMQSFKRLSLSIAHLFQKSKHFGNR